jgi:hypothetical protein
MLRDLREELLKAMLSLENLVRLIPVPISQQILGRNRRNYAIGESDPQHSMKPIKVPVSPVNHLGLAFDLQLCLYFVQPVFADSELIIREINYSYPPSFDHLGPVTLTEV